MTHARRLLPPLAALAFIAPVWAVASPTDLSPFRWTDVSVESSDFASDPDAQSVEADLLALADLDGDPSVVTDEEREMMVVLRQVLGMAPAPN